MENYCTGAVPVPDIKPVGKGVLEGARLPVRQSVSDFAGDGGQPIEIELTSPIA